MNFASTKERILQYLDYKGVTITKFLKETGIKRGFLDTDKLKSAVSDVFLAIIIATYPDINLIWLITGNGEMLNNNSTENVNNTKGFNISSNELQDLIATQKDLIKMQKDKIEELERKLSEGRKGKEKAS